jgi:YidC/Oxa1 family membrane protein insertase
LPAGDSCDATPGATAGTTRSSASGSSNHTTPRADLQMLVLANVLQPLIDINEAVLRFWHNDIGLSWGASIIGLTVVIRLLILPLTFKQVRSMQALQRLQPQMKEIQQRFKDDKQRQQQEMMNFYREHQVNPLGSCLPLILQIPFFIGLYQTLRSAPFKAEVGDQGQFFFIPDITEPLTGHTVELVVMIVLYVSTQLVSSYVSSFNVQDKNQKRLLFLFPFLFVPVVINFEAGLLVYWITTNLWTIGQQLFVRRFLPPPEPVAAGAGKASPAGARAAVSKADRGSSGNGGEAPRTKRKERGSRATAAAKGGDGGNGRTDGGPKRPPPPSPRKKKKRSGRRR